MKPAYDFHLHSCLSPCGDAEMTPGNIIGMAGLAGLELVALTDHNTCRNAAPFLKFAREAGILALPGMELTTSEEVHVVCLFPDLENALAFSDYVYRSLPPIPNRAEIFGEQVLIGENDMPAGTVDKLLLSATDIGIYEAAGLAREYGGVAYPAHINRDSFSLLANLGMWDPLMGFTIAERAPGTDSSGLPDVPYVFGSDAHYLENIPDGAHTLEVEELSATAVIDALRRL